MWAASFKFFRLNIFCLPDDLQIYYLIKQTLNVNSKWLRIKLNYLFKTLSLDNQFERFTFCFISVKHFYWNVGSIILPKFIPLELFLSSISMTYEFQVKTADCQSSFSFFFSFFFSHLSTFLLFTLFWISRYVDWGHLTRPSVEKKKNWRPNATC